MASNRCMHCNLTIKEWCDKVKVGKDITMEDLLTNQSLLGCKRNPIWDICPTKWITPLLHENMGMVNKVFFHMVHWLLTNLDKVTNEEERERSELINLIDIRDGCKEEDELLITDTGLAKKALTKRSANCRSALKKQKMRETMNVWQKSIPKFSA